MYYLNLERFLNQPDTNLKIMLAEASEPPPEAPKNHWGGLSYTKETQLLSFKKLATSLYGLADSNNSKIHSSTPLRRLSDESYSLLAVYKSQ